MILTAALLCAALFASDQRIDALGGNAAMWPGDEANISDFPAQMNNHSFIQVTGVGMSTADDATTVDEDETAYNGDAGVSILMNNDGTTWGFNYGNNDDWANMYWGNGDMGVMVGLESGTNQCDEDGANCGDPADMSIGWGGNFSWGEVGVKYATTEDGDGDATLGFNWRKDCGFWIFDNSVVKVADLMDDDLAFDYTMWSAYDAGGADVAFGWGLGYNGATGIDGVAAVAAVDGVDAVADSNNCGAPDGNGDPTAGLCGDAVDGVDAVTGVDAVEATQAVSLTQTATLGVEANMTDWATLRLGYKWTHELACANGNDADGTADDTCGANTSDLVFGLGFNWGGLTADMSVESGIFQDPVSTLTGQDDGAGLTNSTVTLTYSF